jgi:iron complex outermembrane recepter protein
LGVIQVTATRFGEPVQEVPKSISIITSDELRARGVNDLRSALALVGGISVASGGDDGPAGASPGLLGRREIDDFLLVIDGVPAGGVFIPQFATLNLHNVERIEVIRGPAPVYYGTTAFAGTINVVHFAAGSTPNQAIVSFGSFGSFDLSAAGILSDGPIKQSLSGDFTRDKLSDPRAGFDRAHFLYRVAADWAGGQAYFNVDATAQNQKPASPTPLVDGALTNLIGPDFNQNPGDAKINTRRIQLTAGFDRGVGLAQWSTTLSLTHTRTDLVQGFLQGEFEDATGNNAAGFGQGRSLNELFFDTHLTQNVGDSLRITYGVNELYGRANLSSRLFSYAVPLDGRTPPDSADLATDETTFLSDRRSFFGLYAQARWLLTPDLSFLGGLRWNRTTESRTAGGDEAASVTDRTDITRLSGSLGTNWRLWKDPTSDLNALSAYLDFGNTFQPPQIDFGPEPAAGPLLHPETERSIEFGLKNDSLEGRLDVDLSAFVVDFNNQAIAVEVNGFPTLAAGGGERFKGVEIEAHYRPSERLTVRANYSYNDARYRDFTTVINGSLVQLAGNRLALSPQDLPLLA